MIEEIGFWVLYMVIILAPLSYRFFIKEDYDLGNEYEHLARQIKYYRELFPGEATVCEYCNTTGEVEDQYCHLCGTGLKNEM